MVNISKLTELTDLPKIELFDKRIEEIASEENYKENGGKLG